MEAGFVASPTFKPAHPPRAQQRRHAAPSLPANPCGKQATAPLDFRAPAAACRAGELEQQLAAVTESEERARELAKDLIMGRLVRSKLKPASQEGLFWGGTRAAGSRWAVCAQLAQGSPSHFFICLQFTLHATAAPAPAAGLGAAGLTALWRIKARWQAWRTSAWTSAWPLPASAAPLTGREFPLAAPLG